MSVALHKLTKEQKLQLYDLLQEKKKRKRRNKKFFKPKPKQEVIIRSKALEKYLFCGNGFGKTTLLVNAIHWAATGYNPVTDEMTPVPSVIYLVVDDPSKIDQKIIPEYKKWFELDEEEQCHKDGKPHYSRISYDNGSVCYILTHEVNLLKLEGVEMTHVMFDEPPPRHVFLGLYRGGRVQGRPLQIFMAGTPLYQPWLRTDIYEPWTEGDPDFKDVECFTGETTDNDSIDPEEYIRRFGKMLSEEEKATRFKGAFFDMSGQALAYLWSNKDHMVTKEQLKWDSGNPCAIVIDPHPSKAHVAVLLGCDKEGRYVVLDEYSHKILARGFMSALVERGWFRDYTVIDVIYDSLGNSEMTSGEGYRTFGEVINEVLDKAGLGRARATSYDDKDDEDFVERIREVLVVPEAADSFGQKVPRLRALSHCRMFERDVKQVQWVRDTKTGENKNKLDIRNRDVLACVKYGLKSNLHFRKPHERAYVYNKPVYGFRLPSQRRSKA